MRRTPLALLLALTLSSTAVLAAAPSAQIPIPPLLPANSANAPVETLDLERYLGTWHEVARLPQFFQRNCARDTTATYALGEGETLTVTNRCIAADGDVIDVTGEARRTDVAGALEVSFLPAALSWLPIGWADYWVVDLDPDYRWAVVGGPSRGAMWVLARDRSLPPDILEGIKQRAKARGYVLDELILSPPQRDAMAATENASAADSTAGR